MSDEEIERQRIAGEITLVLKQGSDEERGSLLTAIEQGCGIAERLRLEEWVESGMPQA